jgi:hypothetical protein
LGSKVLKSKVFTTQCLALSGYIVTKGSEVKC